MQSGCVLRVAAGIAVEIEEESDLNRRAAARSERVIGAISGIASLHVDVDGIVAIGHWVGDFFAPLSHNRGRRASAGGRRSVDQIVVADQRGSHLTIRACIFVGSLGVIGAVKSAVPTVQTCNFVAGKRGVGPARSPENSFALRGRHDDAAVVGHVGIVSFRGGSPSERIETPSPMDAQHGRLVRCINRRQILTAGGGVGGLTETTSTDRQKRKKNERFFVHVGRFLSGIGFREYRGDASGVFSPDNNGADYVTVFRSGSRTYLPDLRLSGLEPKAACPRRVPLPASGRPQENRKPEGLSVRPIECHERCGSQFLSDTRGR